MRKYDNILTDEQRQDLEELVERLIDTLTRCQADSTRLVTENRELREIIKANGLL